LWEIEFYERTNGRCPVQEFLNGLSPKADLPYIMRMFDFLAEYGNELRRPYVDYLRDDIHELRVRTRNGQFRFLYFYFNKDKIIIALGIQKKTSRVNDADINRAIEFRNDYFARFIGKRR
jgi:phage-related protein